jgi:HK97 family phage prohead protease
MNRAYSFIATKALRDDERVIEGIATSPATDRVGDIVESRGARFKLPLPFLWEHDRERPVGHVEQATVTSAGIEFRARFVKVDEPGPLKDRLDMAWQSVKTGLVRATSIGFRPIKAEPLPNGGSRFIEWDWLELSGVVIPANADATIQTVKFYDQQGPGAGRTWWELEHAAASAAARDLVARSFAGEAPDMKLSAIERAALEHASASLMLVKKLDARLAALEDHITSPAS